ncbi:MAG: hypothetical protein LBF27_06150 [Sphingobacterium sp.]|jgi:hypothetical protein|nr:hypothetical protein [Sphingobacterium sp.]
MKKDLETEYNALKIVADIVEKFTILHVLNVSSNDRENLENARKNLEMVIHRNGYKMNYEKNNNKITKI